MQIGPRIRVGGTLGKVGEAVKRQLPSVGGMFGAAAMGPLGGILGAKMTGANPFQDLQKGAQNAALLAGLGYAGVGPMASAGAAPGAMGGMDATDMGAAGGAAGPTAATIPTAAAATAVPGMSMADKLAIASMAMQGLGGIAGGIAKGQELGFSKQQYDDRIAAMNRMRGGLQAPQQFHPSSAFAGMPLGGGGGGPPPNMMAPQMSHGPALSQRWAALLASRGIGG